MNQLMEKPEATKYRIRIGKGGLQITHLDREYRLKPTRGWHYLCALLEYPGLPFRPWQVEQPEVDQHSSGTTYQSVDIAQNADLSYGDLLPYYPLADAKAITAVKQRLSQVTQTMALAMEHHDQAALDDLRDEQEKLMEYLMQVYSPSGKIMNFPSAVEQQQRRVLRAIHRALYQLKACDPVLARHLSQHLNLGSWLSYSPSELEIVIQRD